jgi:glucose-1-phosphate cytidylyltransferase
MKVVLLCGGLGMRLREETEYRPKPLVPIGNKPILWHIMKLYQHAGFREFVLCLGYRGNVIKEYFLNYEAMINDFSIRLGKDSRLQYHAEHEEQDFLVTLADTGQESQTGGRLKRIERFIDDDLFMVTYGDGVADIDLRKVLAFHKSHGKLATMTVVQPTSRFGVVELSDAGAVQTFAEKPRLEGWANAGFFVFNRRVFDYLNGDDCVLEQGPLDKLSHEKQLMAYPHRGTFYAMDTYREYVALNEMWNRGSAPWKIWES